MTSEQAPLAAPTPSDLAAILASLALPAAISVVKLEGGSNAVDRVDLNDGQSLNLKTYDELRGKLPDREARAAQMLYDAGLPVSRYLLQDETCTRLPYRFALTTHLPGVSLASLTGKVELAQTYRQMGELLKRVHAVSMPFYGNLEGPGHSSNAESVTDLARFAFAGFREQGANKNLADQLERVVADNMHLAEESVGPVFAHDDFQPANVLVEPTGEAGWQLSGLIDFGNARAADPVQDLAKAIFCTEHMAPGAGALLLEGYGAVPHSRPDKALWFYTLLHRVIMWMWLRKIGVIAAGESHALIDDLKAMITQSQTAGGGAE